jgi:hypothetical protein
VALRLIIEKGVGKIIPVSSPGMHISEIAEKAGVPENRLVHIIRQLTIINIFREPEPRTFAHSTASSVLANPGFSSMTDLLLHFSDEGYKCSGYLPEALDLYADKFDKVQKPELRTAFNLAYNTDMHYFDWIYTPENIPHYGDRFGRSMMGGARHELVGVTIESYDWKQFKEGDNIIDVGGGVGHVGVWISEFVKPGVKIIIQDRPSVIEQGKAIHGHIVELQPHNFFEPQPIKGATVYYLRLILHDWPDSICKTILGHIVDAMSEKSKLLIFDAVWQGDDYWMCGKDDEDMVTGWSQSKRHMNIRTLHMMNKLGISVPRNRADGRRQRTIRSGVARVIGECGTEDHKHLRPRFMAIHCRGRKSLILNIILDKLFILLKNLVHQSTIQIRPNLHNLLPLKPANPTILILKRISILRRRIGLQFHRGGIPVHQHTLQLQGHRTAHDFSQSCERFAREIGF